MSEVRKAKHGGLLTAIFSIISVIYVMPIIIVLYNSFGSVYPICQRIAYFSSGVNFIYSVIIITDFSPCPYGIVSSIV